MKRNTLIALGAVVLFSAAAHNASAQIGSGWVEYFPTVTIQEASDPSKATYINSGGIETFIITPGANRCEARVNNNYTSGTRQFQGEVRVSTPTDGQAVHQVFGRDTAADGSAPAMMVKATAANGGTLVREGGSKTLVTGIYGVWVRVNTIHVVASSGGTIDTYINGSLKDAGFYGGGTVNHYSKYGVYGTLTTASAKSEWRSVRHFRDGARPSIGVKFYQDYNYGGAASQTIPKGDYTLSQLQALGVPNDWASSARIPSGWTVIMYQNDNFGGTSWTRTSDTANFGSLSPSANDQMSSCRIQ